MIVLKTYETPQDLYIIGAWIESIKPSFSLTDDEMTLDVSYAPDSKNSRYFNTIGHVYVLTKEELLNVKEELEDEESFDDVIVLKDYVGELRLKILTENNVDVLDVYEPDEYLMYQTQARDKMEELGAEEMDFVLEIDKEVPKKENLKKVLKSL